MIISGLDPSSLAFSNKIKNLLVYDAVETGECFHISLNIHLQPSHSFILSFTHRSTVSVYSNQLRETACYVL